MGAVISARKRARILELAAAGLSMRQIAAEVKVSPDTVSRCLAAPESVAPTRTRRAASPSEDRGLAERLSRVDRKRAELDELQVDLERDLALEDLVERERERRVEPVLTMLARWKRTQEARRRASDEAWWAQQRALEEQRGQEEGDLQIGSDEPWERLAQARQAALQRRYQAVGLSADRPISDLLAAERAAYLKARIRVVEMIADVGRPPRNAKESD
jgi:AraC-like DNA-binding protein